MLAVDALGRLIQYAIDRSILQPLHLRFPIPACSLYADDVILFCHPTAEEAIAVKEILKLLDTRQASWSTTPRGLPPYSTAT